MKKQLTFLFTGLTGLIIVAGITCSSESNSEKTEAAKNNPPAAVTSDNLQSGETIPSGTVALSTTQEEKEKEETPAASSPNPEQQVAPQPQQTTEWKAPPEANKLVNPCKGKATETEKGKTNYNIYCAVCHGAAGKGDGESGKALIPKPKDFTSQKVQQQTDGAIYWKMTNGRPPMVGYKDILKDEQRWQLVNYIRELGKTFYCFGRYHHKTNPNLHGPWTNLHQIIIA